MSATQDENSFVIRRTRVCIQSHFVSFARDCDAHELITCWKSGSFYIYSTPSIPTTETTHGFCEEGVIEKEGEKAGEAQRKKAPRRTSHCAQGSSQGQARCEESPTQGAP
jgi:hypothetical protein